MGFLYCSTWKVFQLVGCHDNRKIAEEKDLIILCSLYDNMVFYVRWIYMYILWNMLSLVVCFNFCQMSEIKKEWYFELFINVFFN